MLCAPHPKALRALHSTGLPIVEIGAGDGAWAKAMRGAGMSVHAYDTHPQSAEVDFGDHLEAAKHRGLMLAVWPPDGTRVAAWIRAAAWPAVCIVANFARLDFGNALNRYAQTLSFSLPEGKKGASTLTMWSANVVG